MKKKNSACFFSENVFAFSTEKLIYADACCLEVLTVTQWIGGTAHFIHNKSSVELYVGTQKELQLLINRTSLL